MPTVKYPVYIPSKNRSHEPLTANCLSKGNVHFRFVVEPQEKQKYVGAFGRDHVLVLPENDRGLVYSRNWIKDHSISEGHERHWQFDDDIRWITRMHGTKKLKCAANLAISKIEEFVDRYENIALASMNSEFFVPSSGVLWRREGGYPPFYLNTRCYTVFLFNNALPNRWRFRYNEDTDMSLQVLADGWCTILFNAFMIKTPETMTSKGGQTAIYVNDGRLRMSRELERVWPGVVETKRKFNRPQHHVKDKWQKFDTKLIRRKDIDWAALEAKGQTNEGFALTKVDEVKSPSLQKVYDEYPIKQ
jgi:hypothetical protein